MKLHSLFAAALTLAAATAFAATPEGTFDRTLTLTEGPTLSVSTGSGYVHVYPGSDNQIHIVGHVRAHLGFFDSGAEARIQQIVASPPIEQSGNTVAVGARQDSSSFSKLRIDYDVTTPRSTALAVHTGSGSIQIGGIAGSVSAHAGSGSIHADRIEGTISLLTGAGSIYGNGLSDGVRASTGSGSIRIAGSPIAEWQLHTDSGSVRLQLPPAAHYNIDAESGAGSIHVGRPVVIQGDLNKHRILGSINGGGPAVHASTGAGSIAID